MKKLGVIILTLSLFVGNFPQVAMAYESIEELKSGFGEVVKTINAKNIAAAIFFLTSIFALKFELI